MAKEKVSKKIKETVKEDNSKKNNDGKKAIVECRVLFSSVLDKIFLVLLGLYLIGGTFLIFKGNMLSINYGFYRRFKIEIVFLIVFVVVYFIVNWLYKLIRKTMLCATDKEVYLEIYLPFYRKEVTIPYEKITSVSTIKFLWIFRVVIIKQYTKLPILFYTWDSQNFKNEVENHITGEDKVIENNLKINNMIRKENRLIAIISGIVMLVILVLLGVASILGNMLAPERKLVGTYINKPRSSEIKINKNGICEFDPGKGSSSYIIDSCKWTYDNDNKMVNIDFYYSYKSKYYTSTSRLNSMHLEFDNDKETLTLSEGSSKTIFTKEKE